MKKTTISIILIIVVLTTAVVVAGHGRKSPKDIDTAQNTASDQLFPAENGSDPKGVPKEAEQKAPDVPNETVRDVIVSEPPPVLAVNAPVPAPQTAGGSAVPLKAAVGDDYFNDAVFVGDSRTQGFMLYSGLTEAKFYTGKGLNVNGVFDKALVSFNGQNVSIATALSQGDYGKVYIMLGINELGWVYPEKFVEKYAQIIDTIQSTHPNAVIYLQSLLPVTAAKSAGDLTTNNVNIDRFNTMIEQLAKDKGVNYLNVREAVQDENGNLYDNAATDGVHLNKDYCLKWLEYLKTHTL